MVWGTISEGRCGGEKRLTPLFSPHHSSNSNPGLSPLLFGKVKMWGVPYTGFNHAGMLI